MPVELPADFSIDQLLDTPFPSKARLSPDGRRVAYQFGTSNKPDKDTPFQVSIRLLNLETGETTTLPGTERATNWGISWSPDSVQFAFVSNRNDKDEYQLYVANADTSASQPLTDLRGEVTDPLWSPDGRTIAFLYNGTLTSEKYAEPDPLVVDEDSRFNRVWLIDPTGHNLRPLTPGTHHIHEYAWSPDATRFVVLASTHPNPWQGWYSAQLYVVDVASGEMTALDPVPQQVGRLTWSPDSRFVAYVMGVMSDEGNVAGEVYAMPARGGEAQCLTPEIDHSITWIEWRDQGILYGGRTIDSTVHGWIDPATCDIRPISSGVFGLNGWGPEALSVAQDDAFVAVRESFTDAPGVYSGSLADGTWQRLTEGQSFPPLRVEGRHWQHPDGTPVHGFLIYPPDYQPGKRYPLFLHVHGGPSLSYMPRYSSHWERMMTALGCLVLMPNPRGSWGRGHAYQSANVGDLGGGDWQDINAGVDALIDEGLVDPDHMAIGGWSYGGYLVTWAVTQTDRFRCAIAGASITSYESNYGVVKNREWQTTMFGSNVYEDYERHRSRSPIAYVRNVKTPTLLVHGMEDVVAPPQQAIEFYTALRYFGVPSQLVLYPREPHGFEERAHQKDLYERMVSWVQRYLF